MEIGRLAAIWRYPIKSLRGESLASAEVTATGIDGDRTSALFVRGGHARTGKTYRGKENAQFHLTANVEHAIALGRARGVTLERRSGERYFDAAPISLIVDRWLEELGAMLGRPVEHERFRPNLFVRADAAFDAGEAALIDRELHVGDVRLHVRKPIERCVVVTYDQHGGASDPEILRLVTQRRNTWMGVLCDIVQPARLHTGDRVVSLM